MKVKMKLKRLKDVCFIKPPKNESKSLLNNNDLVSFVPMSDLGINQKYININESKELEKVYAGYTYFKENDVLLAKITPCFENGKLGIARNLKNGIGFGSSEYIVYRPKSKDEIDSEYLYYFLSQESFRKIGSGIMTGAVGHKRIPKDFYEDFLIPLPKNIEEQKQIVEILDKAFEAIEQAKVNIEKNIENIKELFQSRLNEIFSQKGDGWEEITLGDIGKVSMCKRILKKQTNSISGIPFYKIGTFGKKANSFIPEEIYNEFKEKYSFPKKGDILLSASGTIGRRVIYDGKPAYFQDSNIVWINNDEKKVLNEYLYVFYGFCNWNPSLGATISRLYNDDLRRIIIPIPVFSKQKEIVEELDKLNEQTKQLEKHYKQKLKNLEELKRSILQKAFSGELLNDS